MNKHSDKTVRHHIRSSLREIVFRASVLQSIKGVATGGISRSIRYTMEKLAKARQK